MKRLLILFLTFSGVVITASLLSAREIPSEPLEPQISTLLIEDYNSALSVQSKKMTLKCEGASNKPMKCYVPFGQGPNCGEGGNWVPGSGLYHYRADQGIHILKLNAYQYDFSRPLLEYLAHDQNPPSTLPDFPIIVPVTCSQPNVLKQLYEQYN